MKYYKCLKFYILLTIWKYCDRFAAYSQKKLDKITDPLYEDKDLEKFRNWYWTGHYEDDIDAYDRSNFN